MMTLRRATKASVNGRGAQQYINRYADRRRPIHPDATPGIPINAGAGIKIDFVVGIINQIAFDDDGCSRHHDGCGSDDDDGSGHATGDT